MADRAASTADGGTPLEVAQVIGPTRRNDPGRVRCPVPRSRIRLSPMVKPKKIAARRRNVRARVRGSGLDLLDRITLHEGAEVVVTISEPVEAADIAALRRAAGAWKGMVDADVLIASIYAA